MEATHLMESLVDAAARETGIDRITLRRLNVLDAGELPFRSVGGARYEACTFAPHLEQALDLARWDGFAARRERSAQRGLLRGIGCAMYVENDGGPPSEFAEVEVDPAGVVQVRVGTQNFGMGHETVFAQVAADALQLPVDAVHVIDGDTDRVARGSGSMGSRSMRVGGTAITLGAETVLARGRALAAEMLEATASDLDYADGCFRIVGTDRGVTLFQVAETARDRGEVLAADADFEQQRESYSSGCHVCEIELDPDTGRIAVCSHALVTDVGRAVNPMLVDGQAHGGAAQGLGQAALEEVVYDPQSGQTLSGSLMDYALPRADDLPAFATAIAETAETDNPLRVKGVGEGPTTGAPAAYMNAVNDALLRAGAGPVQMPATAEKVWRELHGRGRRS
jgi:carbon-monoxide dehydrogenase large subunit